MRRFTVDSRYDPNKRTADKLLSSKGTVTDKDEVYRSRALLFPKQIGTAMTTQESSLPNPSDQDTSGFVDRRDPNRQRKSTGLERRQFSDGHNNLSLEAAELGRAVDQYKLENHRRFVTYEELLGVIKSLGYSKG